MGLRYTINMDFELIRIYIHLIRTVFWKHKYGLFILTFVGFFNSILDVVGIGILIPMFTLFVKDANASTNFLTRSTVWLFSFLHVPFTIYSLLIFMVFIFVVKAMGEFFVVYLRVRVSTNFEKETRIDLYRRTFDCQWPYLLKQKMGYLEDVIMGDVAATQGLFKQFCSTGANVAGFIVYLIFATKLSFSTTAAALISGGVLLLLWRPFIVRVKKYSQRQTVLYKTIAHRVNENINGMKTLKAMGLESRVVEREKVIFEKLQRLTVKSSFIQQMGASIIEPFTFVFIAVMLALSYGKPQFSLASFAVVIFLVQRIFNSVRKTQTSWNMMATVIPRVRYVLDLEKAVRENKEEDDEMKEPFQLRDEIQFRNVSFLYEGHDEDVLSDVSFTLKKNEMLGIIGPSGAGKTTIVDLMLRFFVPTKGEIMIDGKNIARFSVHDLRTHTGYMSQDIFLINGTVAENIRFFRDISDEEMIHAAQLANAYEFISGLPEGFDSFVGERGLLLSGGQRQRIVLARILASRPEILILDEATSALDTESEIMIKKSLDNLCKEMTIIIIAHRLSTIMGVDHLVVLEKGRMVEEGNPAALLEDETSYFHKIKTLVDSGETDILK